MSSLAADRSMMVKFDCEASVGGDLACSASLTIVEQEIRLEECILIDETARIGSKAIIGKNVSIGPWTIVGPDVVVGEGSEIGSHVVMKGPQYWVPM